MVQKSVKFIIKKFYSNDMKKVHAIIKGQVVGVYYRSFIKDRAEELGLNGYVKNIDNKTVELVIEGHEAKIKRLLEFCKQGPPGALVDNIKTKSLPYDKEFNVFRVRY